MGVIGWVGGGVLHLEKREKCLGESERAVKVDSQRRFRLRRKETDIRR